MASLLLLVVSVVLGGSAVDDRRVPAADEHRVSLGPNVRSETAPRYRARALAALGRVDEVLPLFQRAVAIVVDVQGADSHTAAGLREEGAEQEVERRHG